VGQLLLRRIWLLAALAFIAGITAFALTRGAEVTYERTNVFVLRPSAAISDAQIPDAIRGIAQQDSQLIHTVARVLETDRFARAAFRGVDTDGERVAGVDPQYEITSAIVPGSDVIEVAVRGPDEAVLDDLAANFGDEASDWVASVYRAYSLDLLEIDAPEEPVSTDPTQLIVLAILLGLLIGVGVVVVERKAQATAKTRVPAPSFDPAPPRNVRTRADWPEGPPGAPPRAEPSVGLPQGGPAARRSRGTT
jgi:capsular polysaccharide biosynthesis protein